MVRVLLVLQHLFMLWMLIDALRRRAEYHWFFIIMLPFGEWAYFFMVKIRDPEFQRLWRRLHPPRRVSLSQAEDQFQTSPSQLNRLQWAQALYDAGKFEEADAHFQAILAVDAEDREARFGHALCLLGMGDSDPAIEVLRHLTKTDPSYRDYEPWSLLVRTLSRRGQNVDALRAMEGLWRQSQWMSHGVEYARLLVESGEMEPARGLLEQLLRDFRVAPRYVKRRFHRWPAEAKRVLRQLPTRTAAAGTATGLTSGGRLNLKG